MSNNRNTFKVIEEKKEEPVLKKFIVKCSETHYMKYEVEAESEQQAREIVMDGGVDEHESDYDNFEIDGVREVTS